MREYSPENELIPLRKKEPLFYDTITHYTSILTLFKILRNKSFLLNRIDNMNDLEEKENLTKHKNYMRVFVACFSLLKTESIPMWRMYTKNDTGVMLKIKFKKDVAVSDLFRENYLKANDGKRINIMNTGSNEYIQAQFDAVKVNYTNRVFNSPIITVDEEKKDYDVPDNFALEKNTAWKYEKEIRFRAVLRVRGVQGIDTDMLNVCSLFAPINFDAIDDLTVVFNPWINKDDWVDIIQDFINKQNISLRVKYRNSSLHNKIKIN